MDDAQKARALKIATVALNRALSGDMPRAMDYVARLNGDDGLITAIRAWCDTYIIRMGLLPADGDTKTIRPGWIDADTGQIEIDADQIPEHARWAGRLISARVAMDSDTFYALLRAPQEGAQLGDAITTLLQVIALGLNDPSRIHAATEAARTPGMD